jgi:hypothetical protein
MDRKKIRSSIYKKAGSRRPFSTTDSWYHPMQPPAKRSRSNRFAAPQDEHSPDLSAEPWFDLSEGDETMVVFDANQVQEEKIERPRPTRLEVTRILSPVDSPVIEGAEEPKSSPPLEVKKEKKKPKKSTRVPTPIPRHDFFTRSTKKPFRPMAIRSSVPNHLRKRRTLSQNEVLCIMLGLVVVVVLVMGLSIHYLLPQVTMENQRLMANQTSSRGKVWSPEMMPAQQAVQNRHTLCRKRPNSPMCRIQASVETTGLRSQIPT